MADKLRINHLDLNTFFSDRFMPSLTDQKFYFGHPFEIDYKKKLYQPNVPYTYYGIPALGGVGQIESPVEKDSLFKDLANIGISLYAQEQQLKQLKEQQKAAQEAQRLRTEALLALNKDRVGAPIVVSGGQSPVALVLAGTAFIATVGGVMYFLSRKK